MHEGDEFIGRDLTCFNDIHNPLLKFSWCRMALCCSDLAIGRNVHQICECSADIRCNPDHEISSFLGELRVHEAP